jgi:hypothetical protein
LRAESTLAPHKGALAARKGDGSGKAEGDGSGNGDGGKGEGATIGVLGCGIDVVYPKENKKVFAEIEERGALISEFPLGTFPARRTSRCATG